MTDLKDRMDTLGQRIAAMRAAIDDKEHLYHEEQRLSARKLETRYQQLQSQLTAEVAKAETAGAHVSNLERSLRQWFDAIDAAT